jgi:hypothetical protein
MRMGEKIISVLLHGEVGGRQGETIYYIIVYKNSKWPQLSLHITFKLHRALQELLHYTRHHVHKNFIYNKTVQYQLQP